MRPNSNRDQQQELEFRPSQEILERRLLQCFNLLSSSVAQKLIETLRYQITAPQEEGLVVLDSEKPRFCGNALRFKRCEPGFFDHRGKVLFRGLVADLTVGFSSDEAQICDVVRLAS